MKCPICNAASEVLETRGGVKRRRQCFNGHRFTTIEAVITSDGKVYPEMHRTRIRQNDPASKGGGVVFPQTH